MRSVISSKMEELQDAIEDAQYVNAIATQEEGPRPVLAWQIPTEEQLADWENTVRQRATTSGPDAFSIDWVLQSAIGLFLFSAFLKEECHDYLRINFVEEVIRWRRLRGKHRIDRAKKIAEVYLRELPIDEVTGEQIHPEKSQIDEHDLCREAPQPMLSKEKVEQLFTMNNDESKTMNCIGLKGPVLEDVFETIDNAEKTEYANKSNMSNSDVETVPTLTEDNTSSSNGDNDIDKQESAKSNPLKRQKEKYSSLKLLTQSLRDRELEAPDNLFQEVDIVVIEGLRRQYWEKFVESEYYKKMLNFLWFQDRPVVPDDFFTMRVLGRGGFGSVIGTCSMKPSTFRGCMCVCVCA